MEQHLQERLGSPLSPSLTTACFQGSNMRLRVPPGEQVACACVSDILSQRSNLFRF